MDCAWGYGNFNRSQMEFGSIRSTSREARHPRRSFGHGRGLRWDS